MEKGNLKVDLLDIFVVLIAYATAAAIKGITGLGFSTSCLPILALRFDLTFAIPLVIIPSIVSNVAVLSQTSGFKATIKRFWPVYAASVPALLIGLTILVAINADTAKIALGLVLIFYALAALMRKPYVLSSAWEKTLKVPVGFLTGLINGLTGSQVMPVLPYLMSLGLDKNTFVQAINLSFTLSSLIMLVAMSRLHYVSQGTIATAIFGLLPVLLVVSICGRVRNNLPESRYRKIVLSFLLAMGFALVMKSAL